MKDRIAAATYLGVWIGSETHQFRCKPRLLTLLSDLKGDSSIHITGERAGSPRDGTIKVAWVSLLDASIN